MLSFNLDEGHGFIDTEHDERFGLADVFVVLPRSSATVRRTRSAETRAPLP
jgi:putative hemolysin